MNWNNIIERAAWTFAQAFVAAFSIGLTGWTQGDWTALKTAALSGAVAGAAALLSLIKTIAQEKLGGSDA